MPLIPPKPAKSAKISAIQYPEVTIRDVFGLFARLAKKHWLSFALSMTSIIAANILLLVIPLYYKDFFDLISSGRPVADVAPELRRIVFLILSLSMFTWLVFKVNNFGIPWFETRMMVLMRTTGFEYLMHHSYSFFSNNFTGSLTQRVNRLARSFERLVDRILFDVLPMIVKVVGVSAILWFVNPLITWVIAGWLIVLFAINYVIAQWKLKYDIRSAELDTRITGLLSDAITNHTSVQLFNGYEREKEAFQKTNDEWKVLTYFRWSVDQVMTAVQVALIIIVEFLLFYYGIHFWEGGLIGVGAFVLIQTYLASLNDRLWGLSRMVRDIYESYADAKEMVEILKLPHEIRDVPHARKLEFKAGEISFEDVLFSFNKTRTVLNGLNLSIRGGEKVALVGPSGAGKSTIVRLLLRLYDVQGGEILIDGQNIAQVTQESLRQNVSLVPQDPVLFHRTLMENIRYGRPGATDAEVIQASRLAHCDEFIGGLPNKYDTYVGERGIKLSGGERQRVAIARAILKNAPILVLDEATSSLDSHSESLIQDALDTLMRGKTVIVIAHRLSTIRKMDRIIVIQEGVAVEEGPHEVLVEKAGGLYAKLWSLQAGGFLKDLEPDESEAGKEREDGEDGQ